MYFQSYTWWITSPLPSLWTLSPLPMRLLVLTPTALRVSPLPLSPARFLPSPLLTLNLLPRLVSHLPSLSPHPSCCPILFHVQLPHSPYLVLLLCIIQLLFCSVRFSQSCLPSFVLSLMELSNLIVLYKSVVLSTLLHSHFLSLFRECNCRYVVAVSQRPLTFPVRLFSSFFYLLYCRHRGFLSFGLFVFTFTMFHVISISAYMHICRTAKLKSDIYLKYENLGIFLFTNFMLSALWLNGNYRVSATWALAIPSYPPDVTRDLKLHTIPVFWLNFKYTLRLFWTVLIKSNGLHIIKKIQN